MSLLSIAVFIFLVRSHGSLQVTEARGLRALDSNGKSDPYAIIKVGKAVQETKVIDKDLNPVWDETFVFSAKAAERCMRSSHPKIIFELWDRDFLSPDEFLGQVVQLLSTHPSPLTTSASVNKFFLPSCQKEV